VLPEKVAKLREAYPKVNISLHQGSPDQVARMLIDEVAEIGIATESLADYPELVTLPCYEWQHMLVLPADHPLARKRSALRWKTWRRAADHLPPVVYRAHQDRPGLCHPQAARRASRWKPLTRT
jgi:DNA-binding transcriptional LysR family regulator